MTKPERKRGKTSSVSLFCIATTVLTVALFINAFAVPSRISTSSVPIGTGGSAASTTTKLSSTTTSPHHAAAAALEYQIQLQTEFQDLIHRNQHPQDCQKRRILLTARRPERLDGFCLELQWWGRHLQAGVALDRTFVFRDNFVSAYAPPDCQWSTINMTNVQNQWECLFQPISNCTEASVQGGGVDTVEGTVVGSYGIINHDFSRFFHSGYYGNKRIVDSLKAGPRGGWPTADSIEHWERAMGRFWIRAQMVHFMWKPSVGLQSEMDKRLPRAKLLDAQTPFIGMHIRFTDNVANLWKDFGRDANATRSLTHFMDIAQEIRTKTGISTIYLATDSIKTMQQLQDSKYPEWTFVVQDDVPRSSGTEWTWFRNSRASSAAAIATDIEVLRRADYLIGSFQSNVYRLAAELNTAYNFDKYPFQMDRHRSVDVAWYEDP